MTDLRDSLKQYLQTARWFGGKGRAFEVSGVRRLPLDDQVTVLLAELTYEEPAGATETYQIPVSTYAEPQENLAHGLVGQVSDAELGDVYVYDALHDHAATPAWLRGFATGEPVGDLAFHRVGTPDLNLEARSAVLSGEQSNTSVMFDDQSLMKLFRRVTVGSNPDIEILAALTEAGNEHVPALYGWVEARTDGDVLQLGILQQFLKTASDGWGLALASLRSLLADSGLRPEESGGDFAAEAHRLGVAVADMHASLAQVFPTEAWDSDRMGRLADAMSARLTDAVAVVPELEPHARALHGVFDAIRHVPAPLTVQRIHGDLHLGQTLRTVKNWKIIDFEGEPLKSLEERRSPDSVWRDVAGMLRSFDYAAQISGRDYAQTSGDVDADGEGQPREWAQRNEEAFLDGYRTASGADVDQTLLAAYVADKAVYEAVYEARNRPAWLEIPLSALARLSTPT